ncbi:MAG: TRAP transporter substrate-binding protein [Spirochaetales bacterium]|jgi:TRAP-type C4-dicarboxylate transport system substrate-binding protein|nr:TRAP transporter substrate-binding protein [Spirochaetales bacterium]
MKRIVQIALLAGLALLLVTPVFAGGGGESGGAAPSKIELVGGTMLPEGHIYWRTVEKFKEQMEKNYKGSVPVSISLHHSGTLGTEKDACEFMIQGTAVDFYVISPAWIATWDKTAPIIDAPFLFKSVDHWKKCLEQGALKSIEENMITKGLRFVGYGGGSTRHIISKVPANTIADFPKIRMRVQGSPLHQQAFSACGLQATPLDYMEVYNAIKTGVLDALENEPAGLEGMKFYEVAPYYILTSHQIITRILGFSEKRFQSFPKDVQDAILKSGAEAAEYHRTNEIAEAQGIIDKLVKDFGVKVIPFDNTEMRARALPAVEAYAKEIGAEAILASIQNIN